jgi:DNA-binding response OmpR family regulator
MTFLLVEDDMDAVTLLKRALKTGVPENDIQVVEHGVEAALYLKGEAKFADRARFPIPKVILLDLNLPLFDGFEFLEWLRTEATASQRRIPVVVMSSSDRIEDVRRAYALGANSYVVKPADWSEFKDRIRCVANYWTLHNRSP